MSEKKGMFFTLLSLTLVAILLVVFARSFAAVRGNDSTADRITSLDQFISEVESSYLPLSSRIAAQKTLGGTITYLNGTAQYLQDPEVELGSIFLNGTWGSQTIMTANTLENLTARIERLAKDVYALTLDIAPINATFSQTNPWEVEVKVNFSLVAASDVANWTKPGISLTVAVPIEGFFDLQYLAKGEGYRQVIKRSAISSSGWNITNLSAFVSLGEYTRFEGSDAPSFLERFKSAPSSSSCCAIESAINPARINPQNQQKSYADYQFWQGSIPCSSLYTISGGGFAHADFKLDFDHVIKYNVSSYAQPISCA